MLKTASTGKIGSNPKRKTQRKKKTRKSQIWGHTTRENPKEKWRERERERERESESLPFVGGGGSSTVYSGDGLGGVQCLWVAAYGGS
jgi:hypothetical protein